MAVLDHENLDVYHCAVEFLGVALRLTARLPRGERELRDQLKRAAVSVPLNIAEGAGKPGASDRARFYGIARGSAMECGALLDVCRVAAYLAPEQADEAHENVPSLTPSPVSPLPSPVFPLPPTRCATR